MKIILLITTLIATSMAFAMDGGRGWIATPYLGYNSGTSTAKTVIGSITFNQTFTEIPVGINLGYSLGTFWFAADVTYGASGTTVTSQPSGTPNSTSTRLGLGADLGLKFTRHRIYVNYVASNATTTPAQNGQAASTGAGTAIGLNYLFDITNHVAVGANYYMITPTSTTQSGVTTQTSTTFSSITQSSFGVMVAFPLMN